MRKTLTTMIALPVILTLGACAANTQHMSPSFGQAYQAAMSKQIVTTAVTPGAPEMHPKKANDAVQRYLDDEIKQPKMSVEIKTEAE